MEMRKKGMKSDMDKYERDDLCGLKEDLSRRFCGLNGKISRKSFAVLKILCIFAA